MCGKCVQPSVEGVSRFPARAPIRWACGEGLCACCVDSAESWSCFSAGSESSVEPAKISGYLGKSDTFDQAVTDFSVAYADQSERDHETLLKAVRAGKLEVFVERE